MSTTASDSANIPSQQVPARAGELDPPERATAASGTSIVQDTVHAVLCLVSGLLITVAFAIDPVGDAEGASGVIAAVEESPDLFYWSNTAGAIGLALIAAVGLAVLRLVRGRGRVTATVGGLLLIIGGMAAPAGLFMYGAVVTGMVESDQGTEVAVALQDHFEDSARTALPFLIGFPAILLGLVLAAVALLVSRAVPRWVPAALLLSVVGMIVLGDTALSSVTDLLLTIGFAGIAWELWRARGTATG